MTTASTLMQGFMAPIGVKEYVTTCRRGSLFAETKALGISFYKVSRCICYGVWGQCIVLLNAEDSAAKLYLKESFNYDFDARQLGIHLAAIREGQVKELELAAPLYPVWGENFWHWVLELLPKLILLEKYGYTGAYIVHDKPYIRETARLFGVAEDRLHFAGPSYIVKELIVPNAYAGHELIHNLPLLSFLRKRLMAVADTTATNLERVYISRRGTRRVSNEQRVVDMLHSKGFDVFVPEDMSVAKQLGLLSHAKISIMPHGAAAALALAQPHGSTFIEFFNRRYINYCSTATVKLLGLNYIPLPEWCNKPEPFNAEENPQMQNIVVPVELLETIVDNAIARQEEQ